ncbi:MerR family transcriptional regulator [Paenibacillus sp. CAA11]|uniref:MerR family transcriptional regulator n=1 Tax=Paenibacillus sp. CAA11 TaxID=1532905 RepID=UPI000D36E9F0|nr:MerR family transcriptional regulator [Paenibacillus sp. CAA11]AWB43304.1 MerR family transcriptional regulator [Paenibacillus sp. CAA11]
MHYKIDEVARETGLTKRTIRYYEEIGLMPSPQRSEGGTRLYTPSDIDYLKKIISARDLLGFSLQELQHYVEAAEALRGQRRHYREHTDRLTDEERKVKLAEMDVTLTEQLDLLEQKAQNIRKFQSELEELQQRVRTGLARL